VRRANPESRNITPSHLKYLDGSRPVFQRPDHFLLTGRVTAAACARAALCKLRSRTCGLLCSNVRRGGPWLACAHRPAARGVENRTPIRRPTPAGMATRIGKTALARSRRNLSAIICPVHTDGAGWADPRKVVAGELTSAVPSSTLCSSIRPAPPPVRHPESNSQSRTVPACKVPGGRVLPLPGKCGIRKQLQSGRPDVHSFLAGRPRLKSWK